MKYLVAILIPPLALLICRKPIQFVLNLVFWIASFPLMIFMGLGIVLWAFCALHALIVCMRCSADRRFDRIVSAIEGRSQPVQSK